MKKRSHGKNKPSLSKKAIMTDDPSSSWVNHMDWLDVVDDYIHDRRSMALKEEQEEEEQEEEDEEQDDDNTTDIEQDDTKQAQKEINEWISIISWNVLADGYCTMRSHQHLPLKFQRHVFDRPQRQHHVRQTLKHVLTPLADILCLQEVDEPLGIHPCMTELGYDGIATPTSAGGKDGRIDSCALYYRPDVWTLIQSEIIRLDDIATMCTRKRSTTRSRNSNNNSNNHDNNNDNTWNSPFTSSHPTSTTTSNLQGLQSSFCRKNMGLLARLQHAQYKHRQIVVGVVHLYWNPAYEYVKLCQAHYVMLRAKAFCQQEDRNNTIIPFILCGDFNSRPNSYVHQYLTKGVVNAKLVAPWYYVNDDEEAEIREGQQQQQQQQQQLPPLEESRNGPVPSISTMNTASSTMVASDPPKDSNLSAAMEQLSLRTTDSISTTPTVRYMLDYTLNRFCRWLRILGLDAALETEEEERFRTKEGKLYVPHTLSLFS